MTPGRRPPARVAAALLAAATLAVGAAQGLPRGDGDVALAHDLAYVAADGALAVRPADAGPVRTYAAPGATHAFPAWSPDGTRLAAIRRSPAGASLVVVDPTTPDATTPDAADVWFDEAGANVVYFDWRDDGAAVYLLVSDPATGFALVEATRDGAERLARGAPLFWDQTPDGDLLVHVGGPGPARLFELDPVTGAASGPLAEPGAFRSPAASPSGAWRAYAERAPGDVLRAVVEPTGADAPRRELGHQGLAAFAWAPDRDVLALLRPVTDQPHAFGPLGGLDADTGLFEPWTDATVVAFWWAPTGDRVAVLAVSGPGGGSVAQAAGPRRVAARFVQRGPAFRLGVVDVAAADTRWLGEVAPSGTFLSQYVPFFDQYARSHAAWSPDGRWLTLPLQGPGGARVAAIDVAAGRVHDLAAGGMPAFPAPR